MNKEFSLFKNIAISNFKDVTFPYKLNFNLTNKCNSKCLTCNIWQIKTKNELMLDEIEKFFKKSNGFSWVDLTGGEIFLRNDAAEVAEIILRENKNLYHLHIPTNVVKKELTVKNIKKIISFKPKKFTVTFSLDGPEEVHDYVRGVKGNWRSVMDAYAELKSYQNNSFEIFFGFTLSKFNFGKFEETVQSVRKIFPEVTYKKFHMNLAHSSENYYQNSEVDLGIKNNYDTLIKEFEFFRERKKELFNPINFLENIYLELLKDYLKTGITPIDCAALSSSVYLDPYGNVHPCSIWDKKIGNIRDFDYDLPAMLKQKIIPEIKKEIKNKNCPNCWTPCEAYQSIFGNLPQAGKKILFKQKNGK